MIKDEKLVIGKPYSIILKDGSRIMKISGTSLTEEDVKEFLDNGIITADDVIRNNDGKELAYPQFDKIIQDIDAKFFPWKYFTYNLYNKYPAVAISMILKEYSKKSCSIKNPKFGDTVYLVNLSDGSIFSLPLTKKVASTYAYFFSEDAAKLAIGEITNGVKSFV